MKTLKKTIGILLIIALTASFGVMSAFAATSDFEDDGVTPKTMAGIKEVHGIKEIPASDYDASAGTGTFIVKAGTPAIVIDFNLELIYWDAGAKPADETKLPTMFTQDGTKWSAMKFSIADNRAAAVEAGPQKDFQKILDKGASKLMFTTAIDKKTKAPQKAVAATKVPDSNPVEYNDDAIEAATTYTWGAITARPKLSSFKPNFAPALLKDQNALDIAAGGNGCWLPIDGKGTQKPEQLQIAYSADGKNPLVGYGVIHMDPDTSGDIDAPAGIKVQGYDTKPGKVTYLIRVAPTAKSAASKAKKISVSTVTKAPNLKIDYKKELIKFKADMIYGTVTLMTQDEVDKGVVTGSATPSDTNPYVPTAVKSFTQVIGGKATTKTSTMVKPGLSITTEATAAVADKNVNYGEVIGIRTVNTEKKPASKVQPLSIEETGTPFEVDAIPTVKGISVKFPKAYEVYDAVKKKWGGSIKADKTGIYEVRLKNSAKYNAKTNVTSGNVTSAPMFFGVVVGKDAKGKALVTAYSFLYSNGKGLETASGAIDYSVYPATVADTSLAIAIKAKAEAGKAVAAATTDAKVTTAGDLVIGSAVELKTATASEYEMASSKLQFNFNAKTTTEVTEIEAAFQVKTGSASNDLAEKAYLPAFKLTITPDNKAIVAAHKTAITTALSNLTKSGAALTASDVTGHTAYATAKAAAVADGCTVTEAVAADTPWVSGTTDGKYTVTVTIKRDEEEAEVTKAVTVDKDSTGSGGGSDAAPTITGANATVGKDNASFTTIGTIDFGSGTTEAGTYNGDRIKSVTVTNGGSGTLAKDTDWQLDSTTNLQVIADTDKALNSISAGSITLTVLFYAPGTADADGTSVTVTFTLADAAPVTPTNATGDIEGSTITTNGSTDTIEVSSTTYSVASGLGTKLNALSTGNSGLTGFTFTFDDGALTAIKVTATEKTIAQDFDGVAVTINDGSVAKLTIDTNGKVGALTITTADASLAITVNGTVASISNGTTLGQTVEFGASATLTTKTNFYTATGDTSTATAANADTDIQSKTYTYKTNDDALKENNNQLDGWLKDSEG